MSTLQLEISRHELMRALETLNMDELNALAEDVLRLRARRIAPSISESDEELLVQIYTTDLSPSEQERQTELTQKSLDEVISDAEREELIYLTNKSEELNARRLASVSTLAKRRNQPFQELMHELGLLNPHGD